MLLWDVTDPILHRSYKNQVQSHARIQGVGGPGPTVRKQLLF